MMRALARSKGLSRLVANSSPGHVHLLIIVYLEWEAKRAVWRGSEQSWPAHQVYILVSLCARPIIIYFHVFVLYNQLDLSQQGCIMIRPIERDIGYIAHEVEFAHLWYFYLL